MEKNKRRNFALAFEQRRKGIGKMLIKSFKKKLLKILSVQKLVVTLHRFSLQDGAVKKPREHWKNYNRRSSTREREDKAASLSLNRFLCLFNSVLNKKVCWVKRTSGVLFWYNKKSCRKFSKEKLKRQDNNKEEFDPGSGWTLATGVTHASRGAAIVVAIQLVGDRRTGEYHVCTQPITGG